MLQINNIVASVGHTQILNGLSLDVKPGELHVIMGPNGAGKTTISNVLMANPRYEIISGQISLNNEDITNDSVDMRARRGIMMSFQSPVEIPGVTFEEFLRVAYQSQLPDSKKINVIEFRHKLIEACHELNLDPSIIERAINLGFSGGEKKRTEMLQLYILNPQYMILDEVDSGLDVDAIKSVAHTIKKMMSPTRACIIITHDNKLASYLPSAIVHVLVNGIIVETGNISLAEQVLTHGYSKY